jgi:hypothetical protein
VILAGFARPLTGLRRAARAGFARAVEGDLEQDRTHHLVGGMAATRVSPRAMLEKYSVTNCSNTHTAAAAFKKTTSNGRVVTSRATSCDAGVTTQPVKRCVAPRVASNSDNATTSQM